MNRVRRVQLTMARMRIPATATEPKRKVVMPPRMEAGMACAQSKGEGGGRGFSSAWEAGRGGMATTYDKDGPETGKDAEDEEEEGADVA